MRIALLTSLLVLAAFGASASQAPPNDKHCWLVLERSSKFQPEIVTVISDIPLNAERRKYPYLFVIKWGYEAQPNGLPTEASILQGRTLYNDLDRVFGNQAVFAISRTGNGGRTMYYYASSTSQSSKVLQQYFDAGPPLSISISLTKEPEWESVREVLTQVRNQPATANDFASHNKCKP